MIASVSYDLPMPPSVNNLFRNIPGVGRTQSQRYRAWRKEAGLEIIRQGRQHIAHQRLAIEIVARRAGGRRDIDNLAKGTLDLLVEMQVIGDDSLVESLHMRWGDVPGCRVTVSTWSPRATPLFSRTG